jgi:hypothetical protein
LMILLHKPGISLAKASFYNFLYHFYFPDVQNIEPKITGAGGEKIEQIRHTANKVYFSGLPEQTHIRFLYQYQILYYQRQ